MTPTTPQAPLKVGVFLCTTDPPSAEHIVEVWQRNLLLCERADEFGLDFVGLGEHHFRDDGQMPAPLVAAAAMAARTARIEIVTTITVGTLWQPLRLAEEAAVVDVLSNGRFVLGLGLGNYEPELAAFGIEKRYQARVFEEVLDIVHLARTGRSFSYSGRHFTVPELRVTPAPVRRPLPIWLGGMSEPGVRRAARYGAPLLLDPLHTIAELEPWVERYRSACVEAGTTPEVKLLRYGWLSEDGAEPAELWWPYMREMFWNYFVVVPRINAAGSERLLRDATSAEQLPLEAFAPDRLLVGDVATVSAQLRDMSQRLGADAIVVKLQGERGPWGTPVEESMRLLAHAAEGAR